MYIVTGIVQSRDKKGLINYLKEHSNSWEEVVNAFCSDLNNKEDLKFFLECFPGFGERVFVNIFGIFAKSSSQTKKELIGWMLDNNYLSNEKLDDYFLDATCMSSNREIINFFIDRGVDINNLNLKSTHKYSLFENIVKWDKVGLLEFLMEKGLDINKEDQKGMTLLQYAISYGKFDIAKILMENGAIYPKKLKTILEKTKDPSKIYKKVQKLPEDFSNNLSLSDENYQHLGNIYQEIERKKREKRREIRDNVGEKILLSSAIAGIGALILAPLMMIVHVINEAIVKNNLEKAVQELGEYRNQLGTTIASKTNMVNFDIASVELGQSLDNYILKAFGSTSVEQVAGLKENDYANIIFNIPQSEAENILNLAKKLSDTELVVDSGTTEHKVDIEIENKWRFSESARIERAKDACHELYEALENAIVNSYSHEIEKISSASLMNNSISDAYRYTRPDMIGDTNVYGIFVHGSTTFINSGVMTTGISQVVRDTDRGVSYFIVDTLQGRVQGKDIVFESCRARVEVEGTDLSQEEVYAKFINGEHSKFIEIVREKVGEKVGVINNELQTGVDEIELLNE